MRMASAFPRKHHFQGLKHSSHLPELRGFGTNPGKLKGYFFKPQLDRPEKLALVVILHGCTQTAASYDEGSGWSELASRYGFATLYPEQQRPNNPNLCFNWFEPAHTRRGAGEAQSIAQMIEAVVAAHDIDRERIFVTGLSAGGAMTSVMLACYPEVFAGGAIIAGLPYGAAATMPEALQQMRSHSPTKRTTGRALATASPHKGPWPTISVWHGTADLVVSPSNAAAILSQWREIHEVEDRPHEEREVDGFPHRVWSDPSGKMLVEDYRVSGMGHGTPLATNGECGCGKAGAFMLDVGISSSFRSAQTWGLVSERKCDTPMGIKHDQIVSTPVPVSRIDAPASGGTDRITQVIEDALRKAGLMK